MVIDDDFEVVMAETGTVGMRRDGTAEYTMTAAFGDPPELLVILVDEASWVADLVAADRQACRSIDVGQARHTGSAQHSGHSRGWMTQIWTESVGTPAQLGPSAHDPLDLEGGGGSR